MIEEDVCQNNVEAYDNYFRNKDDNVFLNRTESIKDNGIIGQDEIDEPDNNNNDTNNDVNDNDNVSDVIYNVDILCTAKRKDIPGVDHHIDKIGVG